MEHITSRHNPLMGHIRRLAGSAAYRWETGEFLCDSPKLLQEALLWQAEITAVVTISPLDVYKRQGHEPEKADHPHAHRPLGLISPHFTQGQAPACPCFSLHIVLY